MTACVTIILLARERQFKFKFKIKFIKHSRQCRELSSGTGAALIDSVEVSPRSSTSLLMLLRIKDFTDLILIHKYVNLFYVFLSCYMTCVYSLVWPLNNQSLVTRMQYEFNTLKIEINCYNTIVVTVFKKHIKGKKL